MLRQLSSLSSYWRQDFPAAVVTFLLALPLNLGVAMASGVPMFASLTTGVVGGVVVGGLSKSQLNISGPAASMAVLIAHQLSVLPSYGAFLLAVALTGVLQIGLGLVRAGSLGDLLPSSVIAGMLSAIGMTIVLTQLPRAVGYNVNPTETEPIVSWQAILISIITLLVLLFWNYKNRIHTKILKYLPNSLVSIIVGVVINVLFQEFFPIHALHTRYLVNVPITKSFNDFVNHFYLPDFQYIAHAGVWMSAASMAIIASIQALLGVEGIDRLDPLRRTTPPNRELMAQGVGNVVSGALGGILLTSVIVRSMANVGAGARTRVAAILQGVLLFICILIIPRLLNHIPLATLAVVLVYFGYQLIKPQNFVNHYKRGWAYFIPFVITVGGILWTDLLIGVCAGLLVAAFFALYDNFKPFLAEAQAGNHFYFRFERNLSFLHRYELKQILRNIPNETQLTLDFSNITMVDEEIIHLFNHFIHTAPSRSIQISIRQNEKQLLPNLMLPSYEFV